MQRTRKQQRKASRSRRPADRALGFAGVPEGSKDVPRPPMFRSSLVLRHSFRYKLTAAVTFPTTIDVSSDDVLNAYLMALTATTSARVIYSAKIRRIRMWGPPAALGSASTEVGLDLQGGSTTNGFAPSMAFSDSPMGLQSGYIDVHPSDEYAAGWWLSNALTSIKLFELYGPVGTIIQLDVDLVLNDSESATSGPALTGASAGQIYGRYLGGTTNAPPVGLNVTKD
jgi:hypothetical protein